MSAYTANDLLDAAAQLHPEHPALEEAGRTVTWRELKALAEQTAAKLAMVGVKRGDRVALLMDNDVDHVVAMMGVLKAGGVFVNINPKLKNRQIQHIVHDSDPSAIIAHSDRAGEFSEAEQPILTHSELFVSGEASVSMQLPRVIDQDLACLIYTSGSTGHPKGVMFRHADILMCAKILAQIFGHKQSDRTLCTLAFSADHGLTLWYITLLTASTMIVKSTFMPQEITEALLTHEVTVFSGVTPIWSVLYGSRSTFADTRFPQLRYISMGGGYPPRQVLEKAQDHFADSADIYMLYGLTEANWTSYMPPERLKEKFGSIGIPLPNVEVVVVDENDAEVNQGQEGELVHRGGVVAAGYWQNPEKTKVTFRQRDGERVVYSGDLVTRDSDGFIYYKGRRDKQIKVQGYRVASEDIIDCIHETGLVDEACLLAVQDEVADQRIVACMTVKQGQATIGDAVIQHLRQELPGYMVPSELFVLDEMPYTHSAKIDVTKLLSLYEANKLEAMAVAKV